MTRGKLGPLSILLIVLAFNQGLAKSNHKSVSISRSSFPADFIFGTASAAYQYEGAAHEGGRGPSIWDTFTEKYPEKIKDHSSGAVADDSYHRYKEDVALMKNIGFGAYRFSISWSRVLPSGSLKGGVNQEGIKYYNNLINELVSNGVKPFVTLFHWDTPQGLEDAYGSFRGSQIVNDFRDFADLCFREFGDRVKHWMTLNEPLTVVSTGYTNGVMAPGRCSKFVNPNCTGGDSATEPYIVGHNMLLAHAAAVKIYREKYQGSQKGQVGIALNSAYTIPYSVSAADRAAAARSMAFTWDWFMEPLVTGNYPAAVVNRVKERLPRFTSEQSLMLKGSIDFVGVNYYSSNYAADVPCPTANISYASDSCANVTGERNGVPIGPKAASDWLLVYPEGIKDLLLYVKNKFNNPVMYITENGVDEASTGKVFLDDKLRIDYYTRHLQMVKSAISLGADVKGYFAWSLLDNFEWADGYTVRFGLVYVDYKNGLKRYPKKSAKWFKKFLNKKSHTKSKN